MQEPEVFEVDDSEIISPAELTQSRSSMNLTELKSRPIHELVKQAESMGLESLARSRKQDIIFSILKAHARNGENIYGDGVLEILQDGFGFLRSADGSYLAGPDDIYVRSEEHTSELQSQSNLVCRLLLEKKKTRYTEFCCH